MEFCTATHLRLVRDLILRLRLDDAMRGLARKPDFAGDHPTAQPLKRGGQFNGKMLACVLPKKRVVVLRSDGNFHNLVVKTESKWKLM